MLGVRPRERRALRHLGRSVRTGAPQAEEARGLTVRAEPGAVAGIRVEEIAVPDELNEGRATPAGAAAAAPSVTPSTGRAAATTGAVVSAVVIVRNDSQSLAECLDGLASQTVVPDRLLVVDVGSTDTSVAVAHAHSRIRRIVPDLRVLSIEAGVPLGRAIDQGDRRPARGDRRPRSRLGGMGVGPAGRLGAPARRARPTARRGWPLPVCGHRRTQDRGPGRASPTGRAWASR